MTQSWRYFTTTAGERNPVNCTHLALRSHPLEKESERWKETARGSGPDESSNPSVSDVEDFPAKDPRVEIVFPDPEQGFRADQFPLVEQGHFSQSVACRHLQRHRVAVRICNQRGGKNISVEIKVSVEYGTLF